MSILFTAVILILLTIYFYTTYSASINTKRLNHIHRNMAKGIVRKWENYLDKLPKEEHVIVKYDELMNHLNSFEQKFVKRLYSIDPTSIGFNGPKYSTEAAKDLVKIDSVKLKYDKSEVETGIQYCPKHSLQDFQTMAEALYKDIGRRIYIDSGYRSPGRQSYLFLKYVVQENNYSIEATAKTSAMPGYSEHGNPVNNAVDITTEDGINGFRDDQSAEDFEKREEYKWLLKNAEKYNFHLSYPRNNSYGVSFEPWHWHWKN